MRYRELIESDNDDDLFGGSDRRSPTPEKAVAKFKMFFPVNKRVSWSKMHFGTIDRLFDFSTDSRFHAGESYSRHSYWGTQAYTNRQTGLGLLIYEDSGAGTWAYLGAQSREDMAHMIQQLVAADQLEDPEAAKQRRLAKQQARAATVEKKGIRVGTKIDIGHGITAEVIEIKPTKGKVRMRDITGDHVGAEREYSVYQISKKMIVGESNDDDMFGSPWRTQVVSLLHRFVRSPDLQKKYEVSAEEAVWVGNLAQALQKNDMELARATWEQFVWSGLDEAVDAFVRRTDPSLNMFALMAPEEDLDESNNDDDDMFATPKVAFNDVFNEYDEDELIERGFEYGDNPEQDIDILNDYLEDYKDFRVVGISGGEHDLVLHLDRSSKLRETDDDELFGSPSFNAEQAGKLIASTGATSGELVDPESIQNALEHAANRVLNSPMVQKKAAEQLEKWMVMDNDTQWELLDEIVAIVKDINGDGWEPEEDPYYDRANEGRHAL